MADYWQEAAHSLADKPHVKDVRNLGLIAGIELEPRPDSPGSRAFDVHVECFNRGALVRMTGVILAMSPPLIIEKQHIDELFGTLGDVLETVA
jgi:beta-alanine--pyruvate transaminase